MSSGLTYANTSNHPHLHPHLHLHPHSHSQSTQYIIQLLHAHFDVRYIYTILLWNKRVVSFWNRLMWSRLQTKGDKIRPIFTLYERKKRVFIRHAILSTRVMEMCVSFSVVLCVLWFSISVLLDYSQCHNICKIFTTTANIYSKEREKFHFKNSYTK